MEKGSSLMAFRWPMTVSRLRCSMFGHDWTAHRYEPPDVNDLQICSRCGAAKRGLPIP
jgi:hypothetical protein